MAVSVEPEDIFHYDELPDSKTHFRLLRIVSAPAKPIEDAMPTKSSTLSCELTVWPLADAPPYRAVSYTWGDPKRASWIQVNEKSMKVRWNCAYVLWQAHRHSSADRYIWVDAICINQADNGEKGDQVARMGSIFERAERVLACIGAHDAHSRTLFPILIQQSKFFVQISLYVEKYEKYGGMKRLRDAAFRIKLFQWQHLSLRPAELGGPMRRITARPYFQRVWTLPELWLARGVDILCGADYVPGRTLHGLWEVTVLQLPSLYVNLFGGPGIDWEGPPNFYEALKNGMTRYLHAICQEPGSKADMLDLLGAACHLGCENPRDRVYSQLPMLNWTLTGDELIQPDYDIDLFDLALKILRLAIKFHSLLSGLIRVIDQSLLRGQPISLSAARAIHDRRHVNTIKRSTTSTAIKNVLPVNRWGLHVHGYQFRVDNNGWKITLPQHTHRDPSECLLNTKTSSNALQQRVLNSLKEPYYLATGDNNQPYALLPVCAQSGDWLVGNKDIGFIILRKQPGDDRYNIIGEARATRIMHGCSVAAGQAFTIFFEPEDFLVLRLHKTKIFNGGFDDARELDSIARSLGNAVCRTEGSSYAEMGYKYAYSRLGCTE